MQMFEVLPIGFHTDTQPSTSLVDCLVDDMLLQTRSCSNGVSLQISNVEHGLAVDMTPGLYSLLDSVRGYSMVTVRRVAASDQKYHGVASAVRWRVVKLQVFARYSTNTYNELRWQLCIRVYFEKDHWEVGQMTLNNGQKYPLQIVFNAYKRQECMEILGVWVGDLRSTDNEEGPTNQGKASLFQLLYGMFLPRIGE